MSNNKRTAASTFERVATDLSHDAFPAVAAAMRMRTERLLQRWREMSLKAMPHLDVLTLNEFKDSITAILSTAADALQSADPRQLRGVIERSPTHGIDRFLQKYDLLDFFEEVRILRGVVIAELADEMRRPLTFDEAATFHAIFDIIIQQGAMMLVQKQSDELKRSQGTLREMNDQLLATAVRHDELLEQASLAEEAQRQSEAQLAAELTATQTLQEISTEFIREDDPAALYARIMDAAVSIMHSDMASMQIVDERANGLRLLDFRGFDPEFGKVFELVGPDFGTVCGEARRRRQRVIVPDIEACDFVSGAPALESLRGVGIRAVQATPLFSRSGHLMGMISTHWRTPYTPPEGDLRQFDILARQAADVIERKQDEEVKFRLAAIVESSDDAIVSKDLNGIITSWNRGAQQLFGYSAEEAIGKSVSMLIPRDNPDEESRILGRIRAGESIEHYETVRRRKDGSLLDISLTVSPIRDATGRIIGASKIARDITDQIRIQVERKQLLASERAARTNAERATRLQNEFLAVVSHELRTPLNGILGWAQLLKRSKPNTQLTAEAIGAIEKGAITQAQLIDDLLDMNRIMTGKLHLDIQSVDFKAVIESALTNVRSAADAKSITLQTTFDAHVRPFRGDTIRLQQVVWNLVSNAIKFTPRGGDVQISLKYGDAIVEMSIVDTGTGINAEFLPFVFDRFRQADSGANRRHGGLGLGLAIVKQIVELHGGTIAVESSGQGKGATFLVCLPLTIVELPGDKTVEQGPPEDVTLKGVRALVIDDDPGAAEIVSRLLMTYNVETTLAASGQEALALIAKSPFDVILSDIGMPELDGYELIRELRKRGHHIPAIAITAFARPEDRIRALQSGFSTHLPKPVDARELLTVVQSVLRNAGRLPRAF